MRFRRMLDELKGIVGSTGVGDLVGFITFGEIIVWKKASVLTEVSICAETKMVLERKQRPGHI